jgi:hypothetical protein
VRDRLADHQAKILGPEVGQVNEEEEVGDLSGCLSLSPVLH